MDLFQEIALTKEQIQNRIKEIGAELNATGKQYLCVPILKGAFNFSADLIKHLKNIELDFIMVSSYRGKAIKNPKTFKIVLDLKVDVKDKDIILIEDIIDSGSSMYKIVDHISAKKPKSLTLVTLLEREGKTHNFKVDKYIVGFKIKSGFLVGYGMDSYEKFRELEYIAILKK